MTSNDYYRQMENIGRQKRALEERLQSYRSYDEKLVKIVEALPNIKQDMSGAESDFLNGGYVSNGQSLSNGKLMVHVQTIDNCRVNLVNVINKTRNVMNQLIEQINQLSRQYEAAQRSYNASKNS